jgi:hypothetical protein
MKLRQSFDFLIFVWPLKEPGTLTVPKYRKSKDNATYARSPRMRRASWMSFGMIVTRLA